MDCVNAYMVIWLAPIVTYLRCRFVKRQSHTHIQTYVYHVCSRNQKNERIVHFGILEFHEQTIK